MKATAKDLRFHAKELLESVERGEEIVITYRGKPHAKLVPIDKSISDSGDENNHLFGIWKDYDEVANVSDYVHHLRRRRY